MRITIEKLIHGGDGMGVADGKKIFVPYSAPGDLLDIEMIQDHGNWAEGRILRIIDPAPCRTEPRCPVFGICGGCQWQHLSYVAQLLWKREILWEAIERTGGLKGPMVLDTLRSPREWHYRNRIQLHVDAAGRVGFYRARSQDVVEFDACAIADPSLNEELRRRRPEIGCRDRGIALRLEAGGPARLASEPEARVAGGGSFAQINSAQNEQLHGVVAEWLSAIPHRIVVELYAGAGNFTFAIAKAAERVLASDVDRRAIGAAQERQVRENVCNVEFISAPAEKAAARAIRRLGAGCDAVLVDPPRKGCAEAIDAVVRLRPASILYVSCDPATLARDARALCAQGYRLVKSLPIDMFPQTFHVESLTLFGLSR